MATLASTPSAPAPASPRAGNDPLHSLSLLAPRRRLYPPGLAECKDFDTRWIGELPFVFEGTPAECILYAATRGCRWLPDRLFSGTFEQPDEPPTLYSVASASITRLFRNDEGRSYRRGLVLW